MFSCAIIILPYSRAKYLPIAALCATTLSSISRIGNCPNGASEKTKQNNKNKTLLEEHQTIMPVIPVRCLGTPVTLEWSREVQMHPKISFRAVMFLLIVRHVYSVSSDTMKVISDHTLRLGITYGL